MGEEGGTAGVLLVLLCWLDSVLPDWQLLGNRCTSFAVAENAKLVLSVLQLQRMLS